MTKDLRDCTISKRVGSGYPTHLCVLFSGLLIHLVATLTGYVDILLNWIVFLESDNLLACSRASTR